MTSKERLQATLNHIQPDRLTVDFGGTSVTGIHCLIVEQLRRHYGLEQRPVKVIEPFQMLGEIDDELQQILGIDCLPLFGSTNMFASSQTAYHEQQTWWGQTLLMGKQINLTPDAHGDVYVYAEGDISFAPSAVMPNGCYFFNAIERTDGVDDATLTVDDNLEEFGYISDDDLDFFTRQINAIAEQNKGVIASFGGTALGDIAFIPAMGLKQPKGIRGVSEWYMSTILREEFVNRMFERQTDIAIANYAKLWERVGNKVDAVFTCGTDFGTQDSQFCSVDTFNALWAPHYRRMNDWIHTHTTWKVFKHSCGAVYPLLQAFIDAGFDIINPFQINAKEMDSVRIKQEFGKRLTFWGGGIDTQKILPNATPSEVRDHVLHQCNVLNKGGGFVFNAVHNIQANAPIANVVAMIDAINEFRGL